MPTLSKIYSSLISGTILFGIFFIASCQPDEGRKPTPKYGKLTVNIINQIDGEPLVLDSISHENAAGNKYGITRIQYYLSNFAFFGAECGDYIPADDYHLISMVNDPNIGDPNNNFLFKRTSFEFEIPAGCYNDFEFGIGVDSIRNAEGPYNGDLDFSWNMNWSWSGDYIFFKNEGTFIDSANQEKNYAFHIGDNDYYKTVSFDFESEFDVVDGESYTLTLYADLNEFFDNPNKIDLREQSSTMQPSPLQILVSDNYSDMFSFELD